MHPASANGMTIRSTTPQSGSRPAMRTSRHDPPTWRPQMPIANKTRPERPPLET